MLCLRSVPRSSLSLDIFTVAESVSIFKRMKKELLLLLFLCHEAIEGLDADRTEIVNVSTSSNVTIPSLFGMIDL